MVLIKKEIDINEIVLTPFSYENEFKVKMWNGKAMGAEKYITYKFKVLKNGSFKITKSNKWEEEE